MRNPLLRRFTAAIFLLTAALTMLHSGLAAQAPQKLTGIVYDAGNENPLPGVNVMVKGSQQGTTTDVNGNFSLTAPAGATLAFSFIGYVTQEITVGNQTQLTIRLETDTQALSEVVVTGYSTQRKQDIIGSVSVVDMSAVGKIPVGSTTQALQGQAAGVNVIASGVPGREGNVFIRGISSFGNSAPLILIDGVESSLNNLNANDIESIQILKDAGAASIYGVRGSNGVIVVTTKKGKLGTPTVEYNAYAGVQTPLRGNPFNTILDTKEFARLSLIANPNNPLFANGIPDYLYAGPQGGGIAMEGNPLVDPSRYRLDPTNPANNYLIQKVNKSGTDWFHEFFKPAFRTDHNLSVRGATEKATYYISLGYLNQQGTAPETYVKRYSGRVNTSFKVGKHITIGQNLNLYYRVSPGFTTDNQFGNIGELARMMPIIPVHDIMGNYGGTRMGINVGTNSNPIANQERLGQSLSNTWNAVGNVYLDVNFLKDFTFRTSVGGAMTSAYGYSFAFTPYERAEGFLNPNSYSESASFSRRLVWTNTLNYTKEIGKSNFTVLLGTEAIENLGRSLSGSRQKYFSTDPDYLTLSTGTTNIANGSSASEDALWSMFGRVDYAFNNKYLLSGTIRRDGSSRFGPENRFGVFPSVSAGWRLSEEDFLKSVSWINDLKIRASHGVLGSQNNVDADNQFDLYGGTLANAYYDIRGTSNSLVQGFIQTRAGNPRTGWERNLVSNVGFDASLLNYRLDLSVEYYKKSVNGLLFGQTLPGIAGGITPATINIGNIRNSGLDLSATYHGGDRNAFSYSIGANITTYKNKVVSVPSPGYFAAASHQQLGAIVRNEIGQEVSSFYGYKVLGTFKSDQEVTEAATQDGAAPGRFRYQDVDGDHKITSADRTYLGSPNPDFTYGVNLTGQYRQFDLSAIFYGSQGAQAVNAIKVQTHFFGTYVGAKSNVLRNAWSPENPNSDVPKIENQNSFSTAGVFNSYFVEDASFLKLRSLTLGYTVNNNSLLEKIKMKKARFYLQAMNLFTLTKYSGLDPEIEGSSSSFGIDWANYPNNEPVYLLGVNISF
ncbi:TonB-dependent receptor [Ravibacter arvi]|uniref:TonB-dependent receptor n=1 Tax=Ravibacter arvi TaxID=2051041 RepID=A0ABP8LVU2_9BACT